MIDAIHLKAHRTAASLRKKGTSRAARCPSRSGRNKAIRPGKALYKIEVMFGRIKDWRQLATRYDRCAHTFLSAITAPMSLNKS